MQFVWIVQRLASSKSPTKYASTASCQVKMACTWKCITYLPTSRAILWIKHEKGSFQIKRSVFFCNRCISRRAIVPDWYLWGFFTFPALRNSFQGGLSPTVSWSFLLTGSSLPNVDGPASVAIWANYCVSDDSGDPPHLSQLLCLLHSPLKLTLELMFVLALALGGPLAMGDPELLHGLGPVFSPSSPSCLPPFIVSLLSWPYLYLSLGHC